MEVLEFDLSFEGIEKEVNMRVHISEKEAVVQDKISTTLKWTNNEMDMVVFRVQKDR